MTKIGASIPKMAKHQKSPTLGSAALKQQRQIKVLAAILASTVFSTLFASCNEFPNPPISKQSTESGVADAPLPAPFVLPNGDLLGTDTETETEENKALQHPIDAVFVGDVMFGRYDDTGLVRNPSDNSFAFQYVKELLKADLAVANLETPLLARPFPKCPWPSRLRFAGDPRAAATLKDAGFHAVSLANNHVFDMRNAGVRDTAILLKDAGILPVGGPVAKGVFPFHIVPVNVSGVSVGLIAFTTVRNSVDGKDVPDLPYTPYERDVPNLLAPLIAEAKIKYDRVIVIAHWGVSDVPTPSPPRKAAARKFIDLGADAVISHHPHVLQGVEIYKQGLIAYSLGDFLFDAFSDDQRLSGALRITYTPGRKCPSAVSFHPVVATQTPTGLVPKPARGSLLRAAMDRVISLSLPFKTTWEKQDDSLRLILPPSCDP
jgi:poly-gamma-glutamate synthesis protein (capsule biosynthesis protein)